MRLPINLWLDNYRCRYRSHSKNSSYLNWIALAMAGITTFQTIAFGQEPEKLKGDLETRGGQNQNLPPAEISKLFISFRSYEEEGDQGGLLNLYDQGVKIALLGRQEKTNFGFPQKVVELSKDEFKTLVDKKAILMPKSTIIYEDLRFTQLPQESGYKGQTGIDNQNIVYEVRGLRKKYRSTHTENQPGNQPGNQATSGQSNPNTPPTHSGQFYMEIEKDGTSGLTKIRHHAWEPDPLSELSKTATSSLDKKLVEAIEPLFGDPTENSKDIYSQKSPHSPDSPKGSNKLEALRITNAKTIGQVIKYLENYYESGGAAIKKPSSLTYSPTDTVGGMSPANPSTDNKPSIKIIEKKIDGEGNQTDQEGSLVILVSEQDQPPFLVSHRIILRKANIEHQLDDGAVPSSSTKITSESTKHFLALVIKYKQELYPTNETVIHPYDLENATLGAKEILNSVSIKKIEENLIQVQ